MNARPANPDRMPCRRDALEDRLVKVGGTVKVLRLWSARCRSAQLQAGRQADCEPDQGPIIWVGWRSAFHVWDICRFIDGLGCRCGCAVCAEDVSGRAGAVHFSPLRWRGQRGCRCRARCCSPLLLPLLLVRLWLWLWLAVSLRPTMPAR